MKGFLLGFVVGLSLTAAVALAGDWDRIWQQQQRAMQLEEAQRQSMILQQLQNQQYQNFMQQNYGGPFRNPC